jgi:predicted nucleic acid-binding protein
MPDERPYLDTSALAKWYIHEPGSEDFVEFIRRHSPAVISRLCALELRCLLARRRRAGALTLAYEQKAFAAFEEDILRGDLQVQPLTDSHALMAVRLVEQSVGYPLRALDALHLAVARSLAVQVVATADRQLALAAEALGFEVAMFG